MKKTNNTKDLIRSIESLRDHQVSFIKEIEENPFGLIRQTCGAGKTLEQAYAIARAIKRAETVKRKAIILVMSHRLLLNNQLVREYCKFIPNDNITFANLSTGKIANISKTLDPKILGNKKLMDVNAAGMKELLKSSLKNQKNSNHIVAMITSVRAEMKLGNKVDENKKIDVIFNVLDNQNKKLDLVVVDEAHKIIGIDALSFLREHAYEGYIFTATPKENTSEVTGFNELTECSLNFKTAVQKKYVVKPTLKIQNSIMKDAELNKYNVQTHLAINAFNDLKHDFGYGNAHLLVFLDSIESVYNDYMKLNYLGYNVYAFSSGKRDKEGNEIGGCWHNGKEYNKEELLVILADDKKPKIILNAKMITEGIDLPNITGVAIFSKKGDASLYQAVMRGCRNFENKKTFNIYVPQGFVGFKETDRERISGFLFNLIYGLDGEMNFGEMFEDIDLGLGDKNKDTRKNLIKKLKQIKEKVEKEIKNAIDTVDYENDFYRFKTKYLQMSIDERNVLYLEIMLNQEHPFHKCLSEIANW